MTTMDREIFDRLKERMKAKFPVLLEGYLRDAKIYLATIETNLTDGSVAALIDAAHSLKSASGLLGITGVRKAAEVLEYAGKDLQAQGAGNFQSLTCLYEDLKNAFSEVEDDLSFELEKAKAA